VATSDIDVRRVHGLGPAEARAMAERLLERLGREFGLQGQWAGDVLRFHRPGVQGHLALGPGDLRLQVTLGFLLKAMRGRIEQAIARELDSHFPPPPAAGG
jgi:putative polyhydroxyalkanoate system protein